MLGDLGPYVNYGVAVIFFLVGLHLLGVPLAVCDHQIAVAEALEVVKGSVRRGNDRRQFELRAGAARFT